MEHQKTPPNRIKYIGKEIKKPTKKTVSETQKNHPKPKNQKQENDENLNIINNQQEQSNKNKEKEKEKEEYIPFSCIPQLEKNDLSFSFEYIQK